MAGEKDDFILRHGLFQNIWLMQYQYRHNGDGHDYQSTKWPGTITRNWNAAGRIKVGDFCAAYLKGCRFYAIGKVIAPRKTILQQDKFRRTREQKRHTYLTGTVGYEDACGESGDETRIAFYEDFTDDWRLKLNNPHCSVCQNRPNQLIEVSSYPQRIDIENWMYQNENPENEDPEGVDMRGKGLQNAIIGPRRTAAFQVKKEFFKSVQKQLEKLSALRQ